MKTILTALILLVSILTVNAQRGRHCDGPITDREFGIKLKFITQQQSEDAKMNASKAIAEHNCLTVDQIRVINQLFTEDADRLEFTKAAWRGALDKDNFYYLLDDFDYFSTAFILYDYIKASTEKPIEDEHPHGRPVELNFPPLEYPSSDNYQGPTNCEQPMSEKYFFNIARQVASSNAEDEKLMLLTQFAQNNCLGVGQAMKLASLLTEETDRLSFLKIAYMSIYDLRNLHQAGQLFEKGPNKKAFHDFIERQAPAAPPVAPPPCHIEADEFTQIKATVSKESFENTKLTLAKQIFRSKQCFTVVQVSELLRLFSFEDSKLDLAKYAFEFTLDRSNYYQVADVFSFSKSKDELMKFLDTKR